MSHDNAYLSMAGLKARGWTVGLITQILGAPDALQQSQGAPLTKLYLYSRVENCEQSVAYAPLFSSARQRLAFAAHAVVAKHQQVQDYLDHILIVVPRWPAEELVERACDHYNHRQTARADWYAERHQDGWDGVCWDPASPASSMAFLARISTNYLRHMCSIYEDELRHLAGKVGMVDAVRTLHAKVCQAIGAAYPALAEECARQVAAKAGEGC